MNGCKRMGGFGRGAMLALVTGAVAMLAACSTPRAVQHVSSPRVTTDGIPVRVLAMAPNGDAFAVQVGHALSRLGYVVIDTETTAVILGLPVPKPTVQPLPTARLQALRSQGVQSVVLLELAAGYDGFPVQVIARLQSVRDGNWQSDLLWRNGDVGGRAGSIIDRAVRVDVEAAAEQVVRELVMPLQRASTGVR